MLKTKNTFFPRSNLRRNVYNILMSEKKNVLNPNILVRVKQGQDEIEKETVATDYSDAILMPLHLIEDTNDSIGEAGKQKIRILTKTKIFRKKINFMKWECEYLGLKEDDMNEQYIDWQFLRVTNQLKKVISGSQLESDPEKTVKSKLQLEKRREVHDA